MINPNLGYVTPVDPVGPVQGGQCPGDCSTVSAGETGESGESVVSMSGEMLPGWTQCQGHLTRSQVTLSVSLG